MKTAIWIVAGALVVIVAALVLRSDDADVSGGRVPSIGVSTPAIEGSSNEVSNGQGGEPLRNRSDMVLIEPDRAGNVGATGAVDDDEPVRTVAGLPAVNRAMELPLVDSADLPADRSIGRVEATLVVPVSGASIDDLVDASIAPGVPLVEANDGPLGGIAVQPDFNAPGPAIPVQQASTPGSGAAQLGGVMDPIGPMNPMGPGQPVDPATASAAMPNFVLPDSGAEIKDPDLSAGK